MRYQPPVRRPPPDIDPVPLDHPLLLKVREILPARMHTYAWVAGSAAARFGRAFPAGGDVDVWVANTAFDAVITQIAVEHRYTGDQPPAEDPNYPGARFLHASDRLHIMCSDTDIDGVLYGFDITCHAAAVTLNPAGSMRHRFYHYLPDGRRILAHPDYSQVVDVMCPTDPRKTLKRVLKFAERYQDDGIWERERVRDCASAAFGGVFVDAVTASLMVPEGL